MTARMNRRRLLGLTAAGLGVAALGAAGCSAKSPARQTAQLLSSTTGLPEAYRVPLPIPPVKRPVSRSGGVTRYEIEQREAEVEILPGRRTTIMGYDGIFPGPTIEARRGEQISVRHRNRLPVPTVVHLHGGNTAADSDGYPVDLVLPTDGGERFLPGGSSTGSPHGPGHGSDHQTGHGPSAGSGHGAGHGSGHGAMVGDFSRGVRDYRYDHDQQAATLWYHDHRMDFTGAQVWRGLAGFHLIRDDVEDRLDLPSGDREIPLMITDRAFAEDGGFRYPAADPELISEPGVTGEYHSGVLGDVILVNGAPWPELEVDAARYRLRILNASNARRYQLQLSPAPPEGPVFTQIGSDGGLLQRPIERPDITIAAAERYDVIVDFSRYPVGTEVQLINGLGDRGAAKVMRFRVVRKAEDDSRIPDRLTEIEPLDTTGAVRREWRFTRKRGEGPMIWAINDRYFDPDRMDASPELGKTEVWRLYSDLHHPVHIHLSPFQVLSRGGRPVDLDDYGWKDTLDLLPTEYADVAIRFENHRGKYMLHCHNLEHEDMGMMAAFEVV